MVTIMKDTKLVKLSGTAKFDTKKKRLVLPKSAITDDVSQYKVYRNKSGQIVLDPSIPESEAWLYNNPVALKLFEQGLDEAAKGKISRIDPTKFKLTSNKASKHKPSKITHK